MKIEDIEQAMIELESSEATIENVQDLANLYTVYDKLRVRQHPKNSSQAELNDIMPAFEVYCESRRQNQLGQTNEEAVQHDLKLLCQELKEFIETLYANTGSRRERLSILYMIRDLNTKLNR